MEIGLSKAIKFVVKLWKVVMKCKCFVEVVKKFKEPFSGLRQFLTIECPLKMMKNAFYFMLKDFFVLEIFTS